jgi:hypothetical protein
VRFIYVDHFYQLVRFSGERLTCGQQHIGGRRTGGSHCVLYFFGADILYYFSKTLFQFFVRHLSSYEKKKSLTKTSLPIFFIYFILHFFWDDFGFLPQSSWGGGSLLPQETHSRRGLAKGGST